RGFHAANVSHICAAAGIGRGTLYQYFTNKQSVLTAILRETLERVRTRMVEQQQTAPFPPPELMKRSAVLAFITQQLRDLLAVVFEDDATLRILLREAVGLDVEVEKILGEIDDAVIGIVEHDLRRGIAAGYIRPLEPRAVATLIVGGIEKLALKALRGASTIDLDTLVREACALHAIGTFSDRLQQEAP
ncbi:MAG: TetR/AcrR family transcriptional regulator, partial [Kofleriaceae bacterium]